MAEAKKILIVEDEPEMRTLLALELETEGYAVFQAQDGEEGLRMAKETRPDLIISDVLMPKVDGNQFLKNLRASDFGKEIPFIVLTARGMMRDYFEVAQVDGFIEKPFRPEDILKKVADILTHGRAAQGDGTENGPSGAARSPKDPSSKSKDEILIIQEMARERSGQTNTLPESEEKEAERTRALKKESIQPKLSVKKEVLILENDMNAFRELQKVFAEMGATLHLVSTAQECVDTANQTAMDLIILKNVFNKINAEDLADNLKSLPRFQKIPIIIYTSIGKAAEGVLPGGSKSSAFVLSLEGKEMIQKAKEILTT